MSKPFPKLRVESVDQDVQAEVAAGRTDAAWDILERRLAAEGSAFARGKDPIHLEDPSLTARWFNSQISADRIWRARHHQGWHPVTPDMVADGEQLGGADTSPSGYVCRGDRHQELLMCAPKDRYDALQLKKAQESDRLMGLRTKEDIAAAAEARQTGDGDLVRQHLVGDVVDGLERVTTTDELAG